MLTGAIELFLISLGLTYFMATTGAGLRVRLAAARPPGPAGPGAPAASTGLARASPRPPRRVPACRAAEPAPGPRRGRRACWSTT